jgi:hypothetical protein
MKKLFFSLIVLCFSASTWAQFYHGDLFYVITSDVEPYTVEVAKHRTNSELDTVNIPDTITHAGITYNVTSIGKECFYLCYNLSSVTLGNNIKIIKEGAFKQCGISSITLGNNVEILEYEAFWGCGALQSVVLGNNVKSIGTYAFAYCGSLNSINIPNSVTEIGLEAFVNTALVNNPDNYENNLLYIDNCVLASDPYAYGNLEIKEGTRMLGTYACGRLEYITSVTIPNSVKIIGASAFHGCSRLKSVILPDSLQILGGGAFYECYSLESVNLSECKCLQAIYSDTFNNCHLLTSIVVPDGVTSIGGGAFWACYSLESLTFPKSVNYIDYMIVASCHSLKLIDCKATTPPNFPPDINMSYNFMDCPSDMVIYVPCGATNAYKNHQHWSYFGNQIKEASYSIDVYSQDSNKGHVVVDQNSICDGAQITAVPHEGYSFIQWTDGNTDNPRRFEITRDTTFTAVFDQIFNGQCGDSLYWHYALNTLTITGSGAMWDTRPWSFVADEIEHVSLPTGLTYIGDDAFQDCLGLRNIDIPGTVTAIGDYSFSGCRYLTAINCYPLLPPYAEKTSFSNYSAQLNAPCDNLEAYKYDMIFGQFRNFECIGSESTTTDGVSVEPTSNTVTVTWPTDEDAETYTIEIMDGDEIFCLLTFNADGMLLNIAFAPSRDGNHHTAQHAEQTTNGLRFTITNLDEGTCYGYDITAKDVEDQTLSTYSGEFTTESLTAVENIILPDNNTHKILHNGQLLIIRDGKTYNVMGQEL